MDVLNTYGGGYTPALIVLGVFFIGVAILALYYAIDAVFDDFYGFAAIFALFMVLSTLIAVLFFTTHQPVRHEVTLRQGYVIDATKYEVIEQRGEIYVIEEREGAHE